MRAAQAAASATSAARRRGANADHGPETGPSGAKANPHPTATTRPTSRFSTVGVQVSRIHTAKAHAVSATTRCARAAMPTPMPTFRPRIAGTVRNTRRTA